MRFKEGENLVSLREARVVLEAMRVQRVAEQPRDHFFPGHEPLSLWEKVFCILCGGQELPGTVLLPFLAAVRQP